MKINIEETVKFFDDTPTGGGIASSIVGIIGEDLNAWAFKNFMENKHGSKVKILEDSVTTGKKKGNWLDRWILVETEKKKILYQCEIKNWSSTAIGCKRLSLTASTEEIQSMAKYNQQYQLEKHFIKDVYPGKVTKVLLDMRRPGGYENVMVEPLIIYWMPISFNELESFSKISIDSIKNPKIKTNFKELNIFSVSLYLRELLKQGSSKTVSADLLNIKKRMDILNKLISE